jgi:hypothetical protein
MADFTILDSLKATIKNKDNDHIVSDMFVIFLNSDGSVHGLFDCADGCKIKKNTLGYFSYNLKKETQSIIIIDEEADNNNLKIVKSFDYVERKPTDEQIKSIIKNNADYYIFSMEFHFDTGFKSVLLHNPN